MEQTLSRRRPPGIRRFILLGIAPLASILLFFFSPLKEDDPFRHTLALLPVLALGFLTLESHASQQGARRVSRRILHGEVAALGALGILILGRAHMGLVMSDGILAVALLLLLAFHLSQQLRALRPLLGRRLPSRLPAVFFLLPLLVYLALLPWSTSHRAPDGDEPWYLLLTHSLAYDQDVDLANNYDNADWRHFMAREIEPQLGDPQGVNGEMYSRHSWFLPAFLAPAYRLAGKWGALAIMAALTAALAWATLRVARHYAAERPGEALLAYSVLAFAPPLLLYSYQVWVEVPAALLSVLALDQILELRRNAAPRARHWLVCILPILLLPLLKVRFLILAGSLLLILVWHLARHPRLRKPLLAMVGLAALLVAGVLTYNQLRYGNPLKMHRWEELELYRYPAVDYLTGLLGIFYDTAFGLFSCAPIWMLLLPAGLLLVLRRHSLLFDLGLFSLPYLLILAPRREWYGGWSPPFRYPLVILPLLSLALIPLFEKRRHGGRGVLAALGGLTLVLTLLWVAVPGWTYNLAHGRSHLLDHLDRRIGADLSPFFPSSARPRAATWIWPGASLAVVTLAWWLPGRRRSLWPVSRRRLFPRPSPEWGVATILCAAVLPIAASALPTRRVEFESPAVVKAGGVAYPDTWVLDRRRFREGWMLRSGESIRAAVNPGGSSVHLTLHSQRLGLGSGAHHVQIRAGTKLLVRAPLDGTKTWTQQSFGPLAWPAGEPLVVLLPPHEDPGSQETIILDRIEFDWQ